MQFQIPIQIKPLKESITYHHKLLLIGSCFTEHIGNYLNDVKFQVLQNPNGILFDPLSVCRSIIAYIDNKQYKEEDLFYLNEAWHSWHHHSRFSNPDKLQALQAINQSQQQAHQFLQESDWLIITLGSSFVYKLTATTPGYLQKGVSAEQNSVANCHKAPAQTFQKHLSTIEEIVTALDGMLYRLFRFNPTLNVIFTISPVRHLRDGVIENNRSKARLIEAVHHVVNKFDRLHYFPAYELVIDVLRDYRFYDIDMAHPNYPATQFVLAHFFEACVAEESKILAEEIRKINIAKKHKPFNPASQQHKQFLQLYANRVAQLQAAYPYISFTAETTYFNT